MLKRDGGGDLPNIFGTINDLLIFYFKGEQISIVPFSCERKADSEYLIAALGVIIFI